MNRLLSLFAILVFFSGLVTAQVDQLVWGPEYSSKGSRTFIGQNADKIYAYRFYRGDIFLECFDVNEMSMEFSNQVDMYHEKKDAELELNGTYILDDKLVIFASRYFKKEDKNILYGKVMDMEGKEEKKWKKIADISASKRRNSGAFDLYRSQDSSRILVAITEPYDKKADERFSLILLNKNLEVELSKEIQLGYDDARTAILGYAIDNEGTAYMLAQIFDERKVAKAKRKTDESTYVHLLFAYNSVSEDVSEYEISLEKKSIVNITFGFDNDQNIIVSGMYSDNRKKNAQLSGTYFLRIDRKTKEILNSSAKEFDERLVARLIGERRAKKGKEIPVNYRLRNMVTREDGGCLLVAEQYYIVEHCSTDPKTGVQRCSYTYHYNNILVTNIKPDGDVAWYAVIPKAAADGSDGYYLSYSLCVVGDKLHFIFNDSRKNYAEGKREEKIRGLSNMRKSVAVVATLDQNGELSFETLYESKKVKIYMRPKHSNQINANTLAIFAQNGKRFRVGKIQFN